MQKSLHLDKKPYFSLQLKKFKRVFLEEFSEKLNSQVNYIANDKPSAARKFKTDVLKHIRDLRTTPPYQNWKTIYYEDDNVRDLIFKGYKIIYRIIPKGNTIEVFGFVNYQEAP